MISFDAVTRWMDAYKKAWEGRQPDDIVALFTEDGQYFETPFLVHSGHDEIYKYWQSAPGMQKDISFSYRILSIFDTYAIVHWTSKFLKEGVPRELDGIFLFDFDSHEKCRVLKEWWHSKPFLDA